MKRDTFLFYRSFYDAIECLPKKDRLAAFEAVCRYALDGEEPALPSSAVSAFVIVRSIVDANNEKYVNGKKGGRPKTRLKKPVVSELKTSGFENENQWLGVTDTVTDTVTVTDTDILSGSEPDTLSPAEEIIRYLNLEAHRSYQFTDSNIALVEDLLRDYPPRLLEAVIRNKVAQWGGSQKMAIYLRPKTLFNRANFEQYIEEEEEQ